ncbi:MAG: hypothetical protein H0X13_05200 [Ramlibacter sp.]|nr:hypothetical protein [Ramlibacter sp.]
MSTVQISSSGSRHGVYAATLAFVLLGASAPAITRLSLTQALGTLDFVVLRCTIGGLLFLPFLLAIWQRLRLGARLRACVGDALAQLLYGARPGGLQAGV